MKKFIIYYVTEDVNNKKIINELKFLQEIASVVLITNTQDIKGIKEVKKLKILKIKKVDQWKIGAQKIWASLSFVLCKVSNSSSDKKFRVRNVYAGNFIFRFMVNIIFELKKIKFINNILPTYDSMYFMPLNMKYWIRTGIGRKSNKDVNRLLIHDALLIRLGTLAGVVKNARYRGIKTLGNVRSWDNPFYTQLTNRADGYLIWSESMWQDIKLVHEVNEKPYFIWGARPFLPFLSALKNINNELSRLDSEKNTIFVGYAAAFCDVLMGSHEKELIKAVAKIFENEYPNLVILFRPYPVMPDKFYDDLKGFKNILIQEIQGRPVDRYGDGRENIKFGSDDEKASYLKKCNCYLSIGTSFTIEAAIAEIPIVQLYLNPSDRVTIYEKKLFERFDISDHLKRYFLSDLICAKNYYELASKLSESFISFDKKLKTENVMIEKIGINLNHQLWTNPSVDFKDKIIKFMTE